MAKFKIRTVPDPILRQKSKPIALSSAGNQKLKKLVRQMIDFIKKGPETLPSGETGKRIGVGLSAVQVGKPLNIFIAYSKKEKKDLVFLNPKFIWKSKKMITGIPDSENIYEGCLSVPGFLGLVKRHEAVKIQYQDFKGNTLKKTFSGFTATVVQHEMDHLKGILFIDRVLKQKGKIFKLQKDNQGEEVLVEVKFK